MRMLSALMFVDYLEIVLALQLLNINGGEA
jgi:hypothetical protein